jgi:hypothetical protein
MNACSHTPHTHTHAHTYTHAHTHTHTHTHTHAHTHACVFSHRYTAPESGELWCDVYEGVIRLATSYVPPSGKEPMHPRASVGSAAAARTPTSSSGPGGPSSGSFVGGGQHSAPAAVKVERVASQSAQSRPRSAPSAASPGGNLLGNLRICYKCLFFLPLRDFPASSGPNGACSGCRDRDSVPPRCIHTHARGHTHTHTRARAHTHTHTRTHTHTHITAHMPPSRYRVYTCTITDTAR